MASAGASSRRREVRWWVAWRSTARNVEWLTQNRGSVSTVHPAHHMLEIKLDGTLQHGKDFSFDDHVKPYLDLGLDVMPCLDFVISSREAAESAIYQGLVQGDEAIQASLKESAASLAKLADDQRLAGFIIDYEPSFDYSVAHVEALQKFISMLKEELAQYDKEFADACAPDAPSARRRVGVCISNWGIIDVLNEDFAKIYGTPPDEGGADILMSMAYTYYPPEPGAAGFADLEKRCAAIAALFAERATIGIGVASNNKRFQDWFSCPDEDAISRFVRSLPKLGAGSLSLWGMWYRQEDPDGKMNEFLQPLADFLTDGESLCDAEGGLPVAA